jgi:hypothetical protein
MILLDVNVLVYAHRRDAPRHPDYKEWLEGIVNGEEAYAVADIILSGFLRVVTHPKVFRPPSSMKEALDYVEPIRNHPHCIIIAPGDRHWEIFTRFCRTAGVKGNLVPDAYLAALAIESGSEWITTDRGFGRYPDLRWRHPID